MPAQTHARVILPQSLHHLGGARFDGPDTTPVEPREQRFELGVVPASSDHPGSRAR